MPILDPLWLNYGRVDGAIPETGDVAAVRRRIYRRFIDNTLRVKARNITYGTPAAGSNLGNGAINRLNVDAYGFNIEATHMEARRADCVRDSATGAELHEEVFLFRGATPRPDALQIVGSGLTQEIACLSSRNSIITNPSFSLFGGTITVLTEISGWTPGAIADFNLDQTNFYRSSGGTGDPTPAAAKFLTNGTLIQPFSTNNARLSEFVPMYAQIAYNRQVGACDGTLTFSIGNSQVIVALAAQTGWNILRLPLTKMAWPRNMVGLSASDIGTDVPQAKIQLSGRTTGTLLVDDLIFAPMSRFDNLWYAPVGGSVNFVGANRDSFTWTDALVGADSIIQQWLWRLYGFWLPHVNDASETWTDPSV